MDLFGTEPCSRGPGDPRPGRMPLGCAVIEVMISIFLMAALMAAPGALESARDRQDRAALEKQISRPGRMPLGCAVIEVMISIFLMAALMAAPGALESARDRQDRAALEKQISDLA